MKVTKNIPIEIAFTYDKTDLNFLYMNGVIDIEKIEDKKFYAKFPCPFIQKRLFNYFTNEALTQAAKYRDQLKLQEISLVFFVENINDKS